jgi:hypothetical protein
MNKGLKIAVVSHVLGTAVAVALAWFLPLLLLSNESIRPMQYALVIVALAWGGWKLYQIMTRKDDLANRTAKHFDSKK